LRNIDLVLAIHRGSAEVRAQIADFAGNAIRCVVVDSRSQNLPEVRNDGIAAASGAEDPSQKSQSIGRISRLREEYRERLAQLEYCDELSAEPDPTQLHASHFNHLVREALRVERQTLVELRNQHQINDETLRLVQRDIDLADARLVETHY
jgi:hypothetical protein